MAIKRKKQSEADPFSCLLGCFSWSNSAPIGCIKLLLKWFILAGMIVVPVLYIDYKVAISDPPGYCSVQHRYISDKEFIQIAIELREKDWAKRGGREKFIYSGRDFDAKDPNCCRVIREEPSWDFIEKKTLVVLNRIFGYQEVSVELNNETSVSDIDGFNLNDRVFFDICGKLKGRIEYNWQGF